MALGYGIAGAIYVLEGMSHIKERIFSRDSIEKIVEEDKLAKKELNITIT